MNNISDILYNFMLSKNMTGNISGDLDEYTGEKIKYSNPLNSDQFESSDDYWHIPLIAVGESNGNGIFARVSVQNTDPNTLYISFRPLNLDGIDVLLKNKTFEVATKYFNKSKLDLSKNTSIDNIINICNILGDKNIKKDMGISQALFDELTRNSYTMHVENWFSTLSRSKAFKIHMKNILDNKLFFGDKGKTKYGATSEKMSIITILATFIKLYNPKHVIFVGFSLGSALALACSYIIHTSLDFYEEKVKPSFSVYQFCGIKIGNKIMVDYIENNFNKVKYILLSRGKIEIDPVSLLPSSTFVHAGKILNINVTDHTILFEDKFISKIKKTTMLKLVTGYIFKTKNAEQFTGIHLAGEDLIERILIKYLIDNTITNPFINIPKCEYFTSTGYSGKYKICPIKKCKIISKKEGAKIINKCTNL